MKVTMESDTNLLEVFATALKVALDQIHFPPSPERILRLMNLLALSKPQVYRITSGKAAPTLESLVKFRELNISIDHILDQLRSSPSVSTNNGNEFSKLVEGKIEISGNTQSCLLVLEPLKDHSPIIAVLEENKFWRVISLAQGEAVPEGARRVVEIQFKSAQPRLAIVEDHRGTLLVLCKQLEPFFRVSAFSEGRELLNSPLVNQFDAYLLDWRLADIAGEDLVLSIRNGSDVPIFVVTGEKSSHEIARMVANANVRYVVKPVDDVILAAEIMNAISLHNTGK